MIQLYALSFQSPLITRTLVPMQKYSSVYLDHQASTSDLMKDAVLQHAIKGDKPLVISAGGLLVLQNFVKLYPPATATFKYKVVLHDFPGQINPYLDPLIKWLDCDHQAGGAWQTSKMKFGEFEEMLGDLNFVDEKGAEFILSIRPFDVREKHQELTASGELMPKENKQKSAQGKSAVESLISSAAKSPKGRKAKAKPVS